MVVAVVTIIRNGTNGSSKNSWILSIISSRKGGSYRNRLVLLRKTSSCERAELAFDMSVNVQCFHLWELTFRLAKGILHFSFLRHNVDFDILVQRK
jgi:hypothetical protein